MNKYVGRTEVWLQLQLTTSIDNYGGFVFNTIFDEKHRKNIHWFVDDYSFFIIKPTFLIWFDWLCYFSGLTISTRARLDNIIVVSYISEKRSNLDQVFNLWNREKTQNSNLVFKYKPDRHFL